ELGGDIRYIDAGLCLDAFFALSRCPEEGPLSNSQNVSKALLRWCRKLLDLTPFPDLYSAAFSSLVQPLSGEKRESLPLPLSFHAFLERKVLSAETPPDEAIWAGSFLACMGGSLRFSDAQHILWSSLCISHFTLRGICYRTKTTKRGAPFACLGFGAHSSSREFGMNWLSVWLLHLDRVWQDLRKRFGDQVVPDCFFFTARKSGFSPASYAQTLLRLRNFLQESGLTREQASGYTPLPSVFVPFPQLFNLKSSLPSQFQEAIHTLKAVMLLSNCLAAALGELLRDAAGVPLNLLFDISSWGQVVSLVCAACLPATRVRQACSTPTSNAIANTLEQHLITPKTASEGRSSELVRSLKDLWLSLWLPRVMWWT
ncbi:unnamed protein product, partial [Symbiodinium sp. CCMP2456]